MTTEIAKGFDCQCGEWHSFPPYVYAHWDFVLRKTCVECGARYEVLRGVASLEGFDDEDGSK